MAILAGTNISYSMANGHWYTGAQPFGIGQQQHYTMF